MKPCNNETMKNYLSLIKFSHTIFAMPFALLGFFLAVQKLGNGISWVLFFFGGAVYGLCEECSDGI